MFVRASDPSADPERELERTEEQRQLVALFDLASRELAPREGAVLALYVRGVRRRQIARDVGLRERVVKRKPGEDPRAREGVVGRALRWRV
ncbi:MAG: hypothetical protein ICV69_15655 [Thermoleophilaceae bacterium]|nr:hypothetical protein [Thermoleophilaceae bacterium]